MLAKTLVLFATMASTSVFAVPTPADAPAAPAAAAPAATGTQPAAAASPSAAPSQAQIQAFQKQVASQIQQQFNPAQQKAIANAQDALKTSAKDGSDPTDAVSKALNAGGIDLKKDAFQGGISNEQRKTLGLGLGGFGGIGGGLFGGGGFYGGGLGCVSLFLHRRTR